MCAFASTSSGLITRRRRTLHGTKANGMIQIHPDDMAVGVGPAVGSWLGPLRANCQLYSELRSSTQAVRTPESLDMSLLCVQ